MSKVVKKNVIMDSDAMRRALSIMLCLLVFEPEECRWHNGLHRKLKLLKA